MVMIGFVVGISQIGKSQYVDLRLQKVLKEYEKLIREQGSQDQLPRISTVMFMSVKMGKYTRRKMVLGSSAQKKAGMILTKVQLLLIEKLKQNR